MRDKDRNLKGSPVSAADSQCINLGSYRDNCKCHAACVCVCRNVGL